MAAMGCRTQRIAATDCKSDVRDTVTVTEVLRDTVVRIAPDSAMIRALLECDSVGQVRLRQLLEYETGERLQPPNVQIRNNVLTASAKTDSMAIYLALRDRFEKRFSMQTETIVKTVEVNRLTVWQKFRLRLGEISGLLLLVWLGRRFLTNKISV